jgi:hypothetical protein
MEQLKKSAWEMLHPGVTQATRGIAEAGRYDDAIFAAFRYVEGEIQERIRSKSIGMPLLNKAFDGPSPQIRISDDTRVQEGIKKLFEGALNNPSCPLQALDGEG